MKDIKLHVEKLYDIKNIDIELSKIMFFTGYHTHYNNILALICNSILSSISEDKPSDRFSNCYNLIKISQDNGVINIKRNTFESWINKGIKKILFYHGHDEDEIELSVHIDMPDIMEFKYRIEKEDTEKNIPLSLNMVTKKQDMNILM